MCGCACGGHFFTVRAIPPVQVLCARSAPGGTGPYENETAASLEASVAATDEMRIAIVMLAAVTSFDPSYPSDGHGLSEVGGTAFADSRRLFAGEQQWNDTVWFHGKRRGVGRHGRASSTPGKLAGRRLGTAGRASFPTRSLRKMPAEMAGAGGLPEFPLPRGNPECDCHWDKPRAQWVSNSTGLPLSPEPGMHSGGSGVCIVSIARGDDYKSSLGDALLQNKRAFCAACGYRCVLVDRDFATGRHPSWDKILAVQHALNSSACNLTMWVDADVVFLRSFALEPLIRTEIAGTREHGGLNGGVLFFRRSRAADMLLRLAWKESRFEKPPGLEQSALRYALGMHKELRNSVTMYDNLVRWVFYGGRTTIRKSKTLRDTAPIFHAAGCSLFPDGHSKKKLCMQHYRLHLNAADLSGRRCDRLQEDLLFSRKLSRSDVRIPVDQGRELVEPRREQNDEGPAEKVQRLRAELKAAEADLKRIYGKGNFWRGQPIPGQSHIRW